MTNLSTETPAPLKAKVLITLKNGVLDPQGKEISHSLDALGFKGVTDVRQGKYIELTLSQSDPEKARIEVEDMCKRLLSNMVIENYTIEIIA